MSLERVHRAFFAFLEALPSYLVWLQGASALCHVEAQESTMNNSMASSIRLPLLSPEAGLIVASETTNGSADLPSRTWPWYDKHSASTPGSSQSSPGGMMVKDAPVMANHRVCSGSDGISDRTFTDTTSMFVTTTALKCLEPGLLGTHLNSSNRPAGYVAGLGLGCKVAAWAAHNPELNPALRDIETRRSTGGISDNSSAGHGTNFEDVWSFAGQEDMSWIWEGIRAKAITQLMFVLFDHCFNSPFVQTSNHEGRHDEGGSEVTNGSAVESESSLGRKQVLSKLFEVLSIATSGLSYYRSEGSAGRSDMSQPTASAAEPDLTSPTSFPSLWNSACQARYREALPLVHVHIVFFLFRCMTEKPSYTAPLLQLGLDSGEGAKNQFYANSGADGGLSPECHQLAS